jgi:hypothetical protein
MKSMFPVLNNSTHWSRFGALAKSLKVIVRQSSLRSFNTALVQEFLQLYLKNK